MYLKRLITAAFMSSEPLYLLRLNGHVGTIPTWSLPIVYFAAFMHVIDFTFMHVIDFTIMLICM